MRIEIAARFSVHPDLNLVVRGVPAPVRIVTGKSWQATVHELLADGSVAPDLAAVRVSHDAAANRLLVTRTGPGSDSSRTVVLTVPPEIVAVLENNASVIMEKAHDVRALAVRGAMLDIGQVRCSADVTALEARLVRLGSVGGTDLQGRMFGDLSIFASGTPTVAVEGGAMKTARLSVHEGTQATLAGRVGRLLGTCDETSTRDITATVEPVAVVADKLVGLDVAPSTAAPTPTVMAKTVAHRSAARGERTPVAR